MSDYSHHHPVIAEMLETFDDGDNIHAATTRNFVNRDRETRRAILATMRQQLAQDDGTSLRKKAELLALSRTLHDIDAGLKQLGE